VLVALPCRLFRRLRRFGRLLSLVRQLWNRSQHRRFQDLLASSQRTMDGDKKKKQKRIMARGLNHGRK
jgi:hypothetical protein